MIQILIVDDEKPICDLIQMSLTRAGYHCTCVYDGLAAADILERNVFDLILLDVMLPNADGFELMEYIRPLGIPVIFLTARGSVTTGCAACAWARKIISSSPSRSWNCSRAWTSCCGATTRPTP